MEVIAGRTIRAARPGAILLLHDGDGYDEGGDRMQTARAVPRIIDAVQRAGFHFVTLDAA